MRFNELAAQIGRDLSGHKEWGAAYSAGRLLHQRHDQHEDHGSDGGPT
jgi:hypothetical protein